MPTARHRDTLTQTQTHTQTHTHTHTHTAHAKHPILRLRGHRCRRESPATRPPQQVCPLCRRGGVGSRGGLVCAQSTKKFAQVLECTPAQVPAAHLAAVSCAPGSLLPPGPQAYPSSRTDAAQHPRAGRQSPAGRAVGAGRKEHHAGRAFAAPRGAGAHLSGPGRALRSSSLLAAPLPGETPYSTFVCPSSKPRRFPKDVAGT